MSTRTFTYYTVSTFALREFPDAKPYWSECGSGPGGHTIEEARKRAKDDLARIGADRLDNTVKIAITKTVQVTETVEEVSGAEASFFMLKE